MLCECHEALLFKRELKDMCEERTMTHDRLTVFIFES